jgi:hypothetical protein
MMRLARLLIVATFVALTLLLNAGCMLTKTVTKIGRQQEETQTTPEAIIVGTDGSLAFEYQARLVGRQRSKISPWRKRFMVFDAATVHVACEQARNTQTAVHFDGREHRIVPASPTGRAATRDDLPEPLRNGRAVDLFGLTARQVRGMNAVDIELHGDERPVALFVPPTLRRYHDPLSTAAILALVGPAFIVDVVTFPVQLLLGAMWYGEYFDEAPPPAIQNAMTW